MARTTASPITIEHETFGEPSTPPVLLIMGLGGQLIHWDEAFCKMLSELGRYVIRFDNRDAGLSAKLDDLHAPDTRQSVLARLEGRPLSSPYTWMTWPMTPSECWTGWGLPRHMLWVPRWGE